MITIYAGGAGGLHAIPVPPSGALPPETLWIDLFGPTGAEEAQVEGWLGIDIPTRADMQEIEASSRLYMRDGVHFMTAVMVAGSETELPVNTPVTFVLTGNRLLSIRYEDPSAFRNFVARATRRPQPDLDARLALTGLLETAIDRAADILESIGAALDRISAEIFSPRAGRGPRSGDRGDLQEVLRAIGRRNDVASKVRDSLASIERLIGYFRQVAKDAPGDGLRPRLHVLERDVHSLVEHDAFIANKVSFLLDATLGFVNTEQNAIIKILSVVSVVFTPPTLIASLYGMNFHNMPELDWRFGYPYALLLMLASAVLPYVYFRWRGWL